MIERILLGVAGLFLMYQTLWADIVGIALVGLGILLQVVRKGSEAVTVG